MADLRGTLRRQSPRDRLLAGLVSSTPIGVDASLQVTLDAYGHRGRRFAAFGWAPRGHDLPIAGDRVWVSRADDGELVVVAWHPEPLDEDEERPTIP